MRRRAVIGLLGAIAAGAARPAWTQAQQAGRRLIGVLHGTTFGDDQRLALQNGLSELGFVEGQDYSFLIRVAENKPDQLSMLAANLIGAKVAVIVAIGGPVPARTAKAATSEIPIVFAYGGDPVRDGLVSSLNRPGGNISGVTFIATAVAAKRLEVLKELVPDVRKVAMLVNPKGTLAELEIRDVYAATRALGQELHVFNASNPAELDVAFEAISRTGAQAMLMGTDPAFGLSFGGQITSLAARYRIPAIYPTRQQPDVGGLMSYGASILDAWRQAGVYVGRILKGDKPADLPVMQPTRLELVINLKAARELGLPISAELIARADEVIE